MPPQFWICPSTRKGPLDTALSGVAPPLRHHNLGGEGSLLGGAARQALALQDTDLNLRHIQQARMIWHIEDSILRGSVSAVFTRSTSSKLSRVYDDPVFAQAEYAWVRPCCHPREVPPKNPDLAIDWPNQVWVTDLAYLPMAQVSFT
jgi:hypothetical protein